MNKLVVMASGTGSNFEAIAKGIICGEINATIELLIVNNENAGAIERAESLGIKWLYNDCKNISEVIEIIEEINPRLVLLAGYMKILPENFIKAFDNKIINVHPSLLPKYKGLHAVEQALEANETEIGATIHYVDTGVDTGKIITQKSFSIKNLSTEEIYETLHKIEHEIYVKSVKSLLEN